MADRHGAQTGGPELRSPRLLLRRWRDRDREPLAALNADPEVMRFMPARLSRRESNALLERIEADFDERGYGLWALEVAATGQFVGFTGLTLQSFEAEFTPAVEVGWRLSRSAWGQGFATEAARRALAFAFDVLALEEIVSMTATMNERSMAVMRRLGMTRDPLDDFDHPRVPEPSRLRRHVLYRMPAERWRQLAAEP
jgi:RimJ/RimL family protein N-acetyltransferase